MSVDPRGAATIERSLTAVARVPNAGLIAVVSAAGQLHRELVATLSAKHRLPTVYPYRFFVTGGGLISYPDLVSQYRRAAGYVDRIRKGEKPADLPVQAPTKYELASNRIEFHIVRSANRGKDRRLALFCRSNRAERCPYRG